MRFFCRQVTSILFLLAVLLSLHGLPAAEAAIISTKEEISIGRDVARDLEKKYGLVEDEALQGRIAAIGAKLAAVGDRKDLQYSFKVLNSKDINALALPGGFIYVFKGLVDYMPSDDELAGVMGHELGHVTKRHSVKQMEKSLAFSVLFGAIFGDRGAVLQNLAYNAIMAGYSRDDEKQADSLGYTYSSKAGYNPYSMLMGLQKLAELENKPTYGIFSSHPEPQERVERLKEYIAKADIRPQVIVKDKTAQVVDGEWSLPVILSEADGYKPHYRAYFAAGSLYKAAQLADFCPDRFILDSDGTNVTVYYEDIKIITLTPQDAIDNGKDIMDLANSYVYKLKEWASIAKKKAV